MATLKEQTEAKVEAGRKGNPDFMKGVDAEIAKAKSFQQGSDALALGDKAPEFTLPDAKLNTVSLTSLLNQGPVVVTFYRGSWCPYCNLQLRALQSRLDDIKSLGACLLYTSPSPRDRG